MTKNEVLKGKLDAVMVTLEEYIDAAVAKAVAEATGGEAAARPTLKTVAPRAEAKAAAPKAEAKAESVSEELQAEAKQLAGKVMAELGKEALAGLLADIGVKKFSELKTDLNLSAFIASAQNAIEGNAAADTEDDTEDDDLLGDSPAPEAKERSLEDVKNKLLEVNNHEKLGRDATRAILGELGIQRLPQLEPANYGKAYDAAVKALKNVK